MRRMAPVQDDLPDWERLLAAERHLQRLVPDAVLVGGTAAAIHARHRVSLDADHVLENLRDRFDEVLATLEAVAGWETEEVSGLRVPTLAEMARIKAWLLVTRHTVRDYLDTVVLFERLGEDGVATALGPFDDIYQQPTGESVLAEVAERLAAAVPIDVAAIDLHRYRGLRPPWNDWAHVVTRGRHWAQVVARIALDETR